VLRELDKKDTAILKGLAIILIVFHNFFHVLGPVHENEFSFDSSRFTVFLQTVVHPSMTIQALFSFFGHYGVQVFIFLSAYGLAKTHWDSEESWSSFMLSRVKKFYPMFLLAVAIWAILATMQMGPGPLIKEQGLEVVLMLAGVSTLVPGMGLPPVGPWWFIPFILQFYAMWPLLRKLTKRFGWQGLVVLSFACYIVTHLANPVLQSHLGITLAATPISRMRVLCFGIIAARYPVRLNVYLAAPAFACIILGNMYRSMAPLVSIGVVVLALWLYMKMRDLLRNSEIFEQLGNYSLAIFLLNGIVRIPFLAFTRTLDSQLIMGFASAAVTIAVSVFFHHIPSFWPQIHRVREVVALEPRVPPEPAKAAAD
jgi:peptidoglycan/LPS O-acetylase OafA/YrhL